MNFWETINTYAWVLFLLGIIAVGGLQWRRWQMDRQRVERVQRDHIPTQLRFKRTPKISVLVAAWNEAAIIAEHIASFERLRYPNRELVLCAGGKDETFKLASDAAKISSGRVVVVEQPAGQGKQRSLQQAYEQATGDIIFLTDADCLYDDTSFEHTLAPIINDNAAVSTGASRPLLRQMHNPFVLHLWFIDAYVRTTWGDTTDGILGRNAAVTRTALDSMDAFTAEIRTGTDYHMAKMLIANGYTIRYARQSVIATTYADTLRKYRTQQSRWLRNVVMHGLDFKAYGEVARSLIPSAVAIFMLIGWLIGLMSPLILTIWVVLWVQVMVSRIRYMRFGELVTGQPFGTGQPIKSGYWRLPLYIALDFVIWASVWQQYLFKRERTRW